MRPRGAATYVQVATLRAAGKARVSEWWQGIWRCLSNTANVSTRIESFLE